MATNQITIELEKFKSGIIAQSEKTASVTFDISMINKYKEIPFVNLEAYKLIENYVSKSYRIR